jgi:hypothetical protein
MRVNPPFNEKPSRTGPEPKLPTYGSIDDYYDRDLNLYLEWVQSDGLLRTDDELIDELFRALPFARRGSRIVSRLQRVVTRFRNPTR